MIATAWTWITSRVSAVAAAVAMAALAFWAAYREGRRNAQLAAAERVARAAEERARVDVGIGAATDADVDARLKPPNRR